MAGLERGAPAPWERKPAGIVTRAEVASVSADAVTERFPIRTDGRVDYLTPSGSLVPVTIGAEDTATALHGNADFETVSGSTPTIWDATWQVGGGTFTTETADILFGTRSATVSTAAGGGSVQILLSDTFTVAGGDTLTVGAWGHLVTGSPKIGFGILTAASGTPNFFDGQTFQQESEAFALPPVFTKYGKSFLIPAAHTSARLFLRFVPSAAEATTSRVDFTTSIRTGASTPILPGNSWPKESCRVLATGIFTPTFGAPNIVDGATLAVGDRVLKAQGSSPTDGIYSVVTPGSGANGVWARASDSNTSARLAGAEVVVTSGTLAGRYATSFKATDTLDTTNMTWAKDVVNGDTADLTMGAGSVGTGTFRDSVDARVKQAPAIGAHRILANSLTYTNQTTYAVASNATERTALTTTLAKVAGFNLLVVVTGTGVLSSGASQAIYIGIRINGTDYDVALNVPLSGARLGINGTRLITSVNGSSGSWTCEPVFKATTTSGYNLFTGGDFVGYTIQQVP